MSDHATQHLKYWTKGTPSPAAIRVATMLNEWDGLHHFDDNLMRKVDWTNPVFIAVKVSRFHTSGQLSTFDFDGLTRLVFLAHDHCIRLDVQPFDRNHLMLVFHPRNVRDGQMNRRHPTIETAVEDWRKDHASKPVEANEYLRQLAEARA